MFGIKIINLAVALKCGINLGLILLKQYFC